MSAQRKDVVTHVLVTRATYQGCSHLYPNGVSIVVKSRVDDYKNKKSVYHAQLCDERFSSTSEIQFDAFTLKNLDWDEKVVLGPHNISLDLSSMAVELPENAQF